MNYQIIEKGAFSMLQVNLDPGERMKAEFGAMVSMSATLEITGSAEGGVLKGLGRMLSGESFFFQELKADRLSGQVLLAPKILGDITAIELDGSTTLYVQKDGFLAGTDGIQVNTKMQNLAKGLFSGEGFFIVEISGTGTVFISSFGAIRKLELTPDQDVIVDNGHLVAWPSTIQYTVEKASKGWISSMKSGENLVCRFRGQGIIYIQSRNPSSFGHWIQRFIPVKSNS